MTNPINIGIINDYDNSPEDREAHDKAMAAWRADPYRTVSSLPSMSHERRVHRVREAEQRVTDKDREAAGMTKEDLKVLKELKGSDKPYFAAHLHAPMSIADLQKATMEGRLVIDNELTLTYPINDSRTSPVLRELYKAQEELMMQPDDIEEPELSSPAEESININLTEIAVRGLKDMSPADRKACKARERAFIEKAYGVKFE